LDYFEKRPYGWREDDRAFKYIQTQGVKKQPWEIFPSLNKIYNPSIKNLKEGQISTENLKRSFMFKKMTEAINGDKLEIW
jgi:hypothetical protein